MSKYWYRTRRFIALKVLHTDDTPHAVALGAAIATVIAFLPLLGFQTVISIGIAAMFRANKAICVPIVWITNPFTWGPIYFGCFSLGRLVLPGGNGTHRESLQRLFELDTSGSRRLAVNCFCRSPKYREVDVERRLLLWGKTIVSA